MNIAGRKRVLTVNRFTSKPEVDDGIITSQNLSAGSFPPDIQTEIYTDKEKEKKEKRRENKLDQKLGPKSNFEGIIMNLLVVRSIVHVHDLALRKCKHQ